MRFLDVATRRSSNKVRSFVQACRGEYSVQTRSSYICYALRKLEVVARERGGQVIVLMIGPALGVGEREGRVVVQCGIQCNGVLGNSGPRVKRIGWPN